MRKHRMFNVNFITDDEFTALTPTAQLLYIRLIAIADDEGFVGNLKMLSPRKSYINELISAGLLHKFDSGHVLILHWFCHNAVKSSHKKETMYEAEKALVTLNKSGVYVLKTEKENSSFLPPKEKKREEKESKEKEREEKEIKEKESKEKQSKEKEIKEKKPEESKAAEAEACGASPADKEQQFNLFWDSYPKKCNKEEARRIFFGCDEQFETVMEGLNYHKQCNQWVSDNGFFIPDPHNWLRRKGWQDRPPLYKPKNSAPPAVCSGALGAEELAAIQRALAEG